MDFEPVIDDPKLMDPGIFRSEPMGLEDGMLSMSLEDQIHYKQSTSTIVLNFAGPRVHIAKDVDDIRNVVMARMRAIGKRMHSVVNYDEFLRDEDVMDSYADLVKNVDDQYYLSVSRYSTSAFPRLKLGRELARRDLSPHIYESAGEAKSARGSEE